MLVYQRHLPDLERWDGWHALVIGDRLVGLLSTRKVAVDVVNQAVDRRAIVLICQIHAAQARASKEAAEAGPSRRAA